MKEEEKTLQLLLRFFLRFLFKFSSCVVGFFFENRDIIFCFDDDNNSIDQIMEKTLNIRRHVIVILLLILPFRIDSNPNRSQNH